MLSKASVLTTHPGAELPEWHLYLPPTWISNSPRRMQWLFKDLPSNFTLNLKNWQDWARQLKAIYLPGEQAQHSAQEFKCFIMKIFFFLVEYLSVVLVHQESYT